MPELEILHQKGCINAQALPEVVKLLLGNIYLVMTTITIALSTAFPKVFENMAKEALSINANTLQFFTRNPRGGKAKDIDMDDVAKFLKILDEIILALLLPMRLTHLTHVQKMLL